MGRTEKSSMMLSKRSPMRCAPEQYHWFPCWCLAFIVRCPVAMLLRSMPQHLGEGGGVLFETWRAPGLQWHSLAWRSPAVSVGLFVMDAPQ